MGGLGSGRRWDSAKATVEDYRCIDAVRWQREGIFKPGSHGRWLQQIWNDPRRKGETSIGFEPHCDEGGGAVRLKYTIIRGRKKTEIDYAVPLTSTLTPWGKLRWWFICPLDVEGRPCGRRVRKLYLGGKYFGCRYCHDLTYRTCQESRKISGLFSRIANDLGMSREDVERTLRRGMDE